MHRDRGNPRRVDAVNGGGTNVRSRSWLAVLAAVSLALIAPAAEATPSNDAITHTTAALTVKSYNVGATAQVFVQLRNPTTNSVVNCVSGSHADHWISSAHPRFAQMYSAIQAAALSQRQVIVDFELISNVCWIKRVQVEF